MIKTALIAPIFMFLTACSTLGTQLYEKDINALYKGATVERVAQDCPGEFKRVDNPYKESWTCSKGRWTYLYVFENGIYDRVVIKYKRGTRPKSGGMGFLCKRALGRGDKGAINVHCR